MSAHGAEILKAVVLEVLGQPAERRGNEWRYGRHGSLVVNIGGQRAGTWRDFEAGHGGGTLELLRHYQDLDKPQALEWLRARGLLPNSRPESRPTVLPALGTSQGPKTPENAPQRRRSGHPGRTRTCFDASIGRAPGGRPPSPSRRRRSIRRRCAGQPPAVAAGAPDRRRGAAVHVDAQGQPALDRPAEAGGREKRAMGMLQGAAVVLGQPPPAGGLSSDPRCRGPGRRRAKRKENWRRLRSSTYASNRSNSALGGKRQKGTARV